MLLDQLSKEMYMLRIIGELDTGVDVVVEDEIGDYHCVVVGFLRGDDNDRDKAFCKIEVFEGQVVAGDEKTGLTVADWDVVVGFSVEELGELRDYLLDDIAYVYRTAFDKETLAVLEVAE